MRQGHQNRRGRGRSNNNNNNNNTTNHNRRNQNPLTRSFESTGPDIKIRGTPAHVAEKYMALARDAALSGDPVLAENYLQHAEHYNRIIMAVREQQSGQGGDPNAVAMVRPSTGGLSDRFGVPEDFGDDEGDDGQPEGASAPGLEGQPQPPPQQGQGFQPRGDNGQRFEHRRDRNNDFRNGSERQDRGDRDRGDRDRGDRDRGYDRNFDRSGGQRQFRDDRPRDDRPRDDRPRDDRGNRGDQGGDGGSAPRRRDNFRAPPQSGPDADATPATAAGHEQPEFLRRPVRRPRRDDDQVAPPAAPVDENQD